MKVSTRTRYGLRCLIYLGARYNSGYIQLKDIADEQQISIKYLEQIMRILKPSGFINASRGMKGGYELALPPAEIDLKKVFETLEGPMVLLDCVDDKSRCGLNETCPTFDFWNEMAVYIQEFLAKYTLDKLVDKYQTKSDMYYI